MRLDHYDGLTTEKLVQPRLKCGRDDRFTGVQHRDQHGVRVEVALVGSPNDAAERLLRVSARYVRLPPQTFRLTTALGPYALPGFRPGR